jgi:ribosomal protein L11 methyltransferase
MSNDHFQISVTVKADQIEALSDLFADLGADAITMTDAKDEPLFQLAPEDEPHWQDTTIHALFNANDFSAENIVQTLQENNPHYQSLDFFIEKIANENWVEKTQKHFQPQCFGKQLWICPQWEKDVWAQSHNDKKSTAVFIEPGLAFGTGTHPTTQLCLTWLANHPPKKLNVIDYGCGSGILALAACALGAKNVWATDHDDQALISTHNNANYNTFKNNLYIVNTTDIQSARADVLLANILANPLVELAPKLTELVSPKGKLILSGVLTQDADRVLGAYLPHFTHVDTKQQGEWVLIELTRN